MLFCANLLFLHVPKTGGTSIKQYLLGVLPRPVYYVHPAPCASAEEINASAFGSGVVHIVGNTHQTLDEAAQIVRDFGFDIEAFRAIIAMVRNPYEMEVSRYSYLRSSKVNVLDGNKLLAMKGDFERFASQSENHAGEQRSIEKYFLLGGSKPNNLFITKLETIDGELPRILREIDIEPGGIVPRINTSQHDDFLSYYSRESEYSVYQRYRWIFDGGFYDRMAVDEYSCGLSARPEVDSGVASRD